MEKESLTPPSYTPKEMEELEKSRRETDAELIKGGADYKINVITGDQQEKIEKEHEGEWAPDVASWVRLHKEIACPKEEIDPEERKRIELNIGALIPQGDLYYLFIDNEGNIAGFRIIPEKIETLKNLNSIDVVSRIPRELEEKGFNRVVNRGLEDIMRGLVHIHKEKVKEEMEERKKKEFDF